MKERANSPNSRGQRRENTRLKSRVLIQSLFDRNSPDVVRVSVGSVSLVYRQELAESLRSSYPLHLGYAVNKSVSSAVDRNRIKRLMREAVRAQSKTLIHHIPADKSLLIMTVFRSSLQNDPFSKDFGSKLGIDIGKAIQKVKSRLN